MKKVRLLGVVGLAPALGMAAPAGNAAAGVAQQPNHTGKTVSLDHTGTPFVNCSGGHFRSSLSTRDHFRGTIHYDGGLCVRSQQGILDHSQKGLTERVRFYSGGGRLERTTWQAGHIFRGFTSWYSLPNMYAHEVCQALVANSNHNHVEYGPVCEFT